MKMNPKEIEPGTKIGYHPVGEDDVRQVAIVDRHTATGVVVMMEDDPWIEERVPYDRIESVEADDG